MPRIQRANVVLRVPEEEVQHYLKLGFTLTSESGKKVIAEATPHDISALQTAYIKHEEQIARYEDTIAKLTAELTALKSAQANAEANKPKRTKKAAE